MNNCEETIKSVPDYFGCNVFNEAVMRSKLPKNIYKALLRTQKLGLPLLDEEVAEVIASAMKEWAVERGATHYTHWFQPMTGVTAEKHDSFITPASDGRVIMDFSGAALIKGEPDASSLPSGGLRATFEARGYTAWDPTSPAFIKDGSLYIPTAFCSYTGEILDKKTPLLRSMDVLSEQALRVLRLFGDENSSRVITTAGAEQEYFLIDKELFDKRKDLLFAGRTLFGNKPPKGQELEDHYFGNIKERVLNYMKDLDEELWKLGVFAKTRHNETAPAQHELAPMHTTSNVASDQNQLIMELMKKIALKRGFACLLHEKPFAGVNGSGKHNNWSIKTDDKRNLLDPGGNPRDNIQFITFLLAVIRAVDEYADLFRIAVASAGNDHRLGASEAPPAIMSIYIGDELTAVLEALESGDMTGDAGGVFLERELSVSAEALLKFPKDTADRNRTSPIAFTGNKFEFRALGSADSIACINMMINITVAKVLKDFADRLEISEDFEADLIKILVETYKNHKRIIFNGNGYDEAWLKEAEDRGLHNYPSAADAIPHYTDAKNVTLFEEFGVLNITEIASRTGILLENYSKIICIEALTMSDMSRKQIIPAGIEWAKSLAESVSVKKISGISCDTEIFLADKASELTNGIFEATGSLEALLSELKETADPETAAEFCRDKILIAMDSLRGLADELEAITPEKIWPFPAYSDLLFKI